MDGLLFHITLTMTWSSTYCLKVCQEPWRMLLKLSPPLSLLYAFQDYLMSPATLIKTIKTIHSTFLQTNLIEDYVIDVFFFQMIPSWGKLIVNVKEERLSY